MARKIWIEAIDVRRLVLQLTIHAAAPIASTAVNLSIVQPAVWVALLGIGDLLDAAGFQIDRTKA